MDKQNKDFYKNFRIIIIPIVFLGFYVLAFMVDPYRSWSSFFNRSPFEIVSELIFVFIFCWLITEISLLVSRRLDKRIPWIVNPLRRFIVQFIIQIITTVLFLYFYLNTSFLLMAKNIDKINDLDHIAIRQSFVVSVILSILVSLVYTGNFFLREWRGAMVETAQLNLKAAELKQTALQAELQSLKVQLDPHFMFNNFSTLSALISEDPALAQHFLDNLSRVYRYMIINLNKNIISVEEEINLAKAYFYLIKIRLGQNVQMQLSVSEEGLKKGIPPITLQLLIENAIKHNMASRSKPLLITIGEDDEGNLLVCNTLQRLNYNIPSTKTGLKNIESRYKLLSDQSPEITETNCLFIVKVPLLNISS